MVGAVELGVGLEGFWGWVGRGSWAGGLGGCARGGVLSGEGVSLPFMSIVVGLEMSFGWGCRRTVLAAPDGLDAGRVVGVAAKAGFEGVAAAVG